MPVFVYEPDAFEKLVAVEGERYRENQKYSHEQAFDVWKKEWKECIAREPELMTKYPNEVFKKEYEHYVDVALYGVWGVNRYLVLFSGEIVLNKVSVGEIEALERAKANGFRLWPPG